MPGIPGPLTAIINGANGSIWAFNANTGDVIHMQDSKVLERHTPAPNEKTLTIASDQHGNIWMAGDTLGYFHKNAVTMISEFGPRYGYIRTTAVDDDGALLFGATKGLLQLVNGKLQAMTVANGLPCGWMNAVIFDNHRSLWISANKGKTQKST
jgi:ligand-binding sensor domain-containing protein